MLQIDFCPNFYSTIIYPGFFSNLLRTLCILQQTWIKNFPHSFHQLICALSSNLYKKLEERTAGKKRAIQAQKERVIRPK